MTAVCEGTAVRPISEILTDLNRVSRELREHTRGHRVLTCQCAVCKAWFAVLKASNDLAEEMP